MEFMTTQLETILEGHQLGHEFRGANIYNNVAVTKDGSRYAIVEQRKLEIRDFPADGLELNGLKLEYVQSYQGLKIGNVCLLTGGSMVFVGYTPQRTTIVGCGE